MPSTSTIDQLWESYDTYRAYKDHDYACSASSAISGKPINDIGVSFTTTNTTLINDIGASTAAKTISNITDDFNLTSSVDFYYAPSPSSTLGTSYNPYPDIKFNDGVAIYDDAHECYFFHKEPIINKKEQDKGEKNNMKNVMNFDFGPCTDNSNIRMSAYGLSVPNINNTWVAYDKFTGKIIDVELLSVKDTGKYIYKVPTAISAVTPGDIVIHNRRPMIITEITQEQKIVAVDPYAGEEKIIIPTTSPFGFNFITKVVCLFDNMVANNSPSAENPFGNMLPYIMLSGENEVNPMMFLAMSGNMGNINPWMLMALTGDSKDINPWMLMMMMGNNGMGNMFNNNCNCGCHDTPSN